MNRLWRLFRRPFKNLFYQRKAIDHLEKLEKTAEIKRAPRYPSEQKCYEKVRHDKRIVEEVNKRNDNVIQNVNKIKITSTEPKDRWNPAKQLKPHEFEWVRRNDDIWEFGFYEPSAEKVPKGKLTFREAIEVMRIQSDMQYISTLDESRKKILLPQVTESLEKHAAVQRIEKNDLENVWTYFRPFERKTEQIVVRNRDVEDVKDALLGYSRTPKLPSFSEMFASVKRIFARKRISELESGIVEEQDRFSKVRAVRQIEEERLSRLLESHQKEDGEKEKESKQLEDVTNQRQMKHFK